MKSALIAVLIFLTLWVNGQSTETFECGTTPTATQDVNLSQLGGIYITSLGELRVLMVFVRFPDDNDPHPYWPAGQPPLNMDNFVDPDLQTGTQLNYNLTYYFDVMSRVNPASQGVFAVVGEEVYVEAPQPRSNYPSGLML